MTVTVEMPLSLPSASNLREHWSARHKRVKAQRLAVGLMLRANMTATTLRIEHGADPICAGDGRVLVVRMTRVSPRQLDDDNLRGAFKGVRDEVAAYFGVKDNDPRIAWRYAQERGPRGVRIVFDVERAVRAA